MQADLGQINAAIQTLQAVSVVLGILAFVGPVMVSALLWKLSKSFVSKDEFNGLGSRVTAYESLLIQTRERADLAHEQMSRTEEKWTVELRYLRRDVDEILSRMRDKENGE